MSGRDQESSPRREVRVSRVFPAPPKLVFNAWLDPDQIASWWAPEGCDVPRDSVEVDPRVGGRVHFSIIDPERGAVYAVRFEIVEMSEPGLLVLASEAQPELGLPHPMITRIVIDSEGAGTRVTVIQGPHTAEMEDRVSAGWVGSLDKLARLLAAAR
jgi:uncharacterized protein YndB with AHSA1/START domain